jgi:transcriptional regulator with XRE-family HTH domain
MPARPPSPWAGYVRALLDTRFAGNGAALAAEVGVGRSAVSRWLRGAIPRIEHVRAVAQLTGDPLIVLLRLAYGIESESAMTPEEAIQADEHLDQAAKEVLLALYRQLREKYGWDPSNRAHRTAV